MKEKILLIWKHLKQGTLKKMWKQTLWIYQYGRRYWKAMILYTLLGLVGTGVSLVSSLISRDLVDIVTGHQSGKLISTFAAMIGFSVANILVSQASGYASTFINLKVDSTFRRAATPSETAFFVKTRFSAYSKSAVVWITRFTTAS